MRNSGRLPLESAEVRLWIVRLEASEGNFARCLSWLSPDETARAERFHFPRHRRAFTLGRAALRALLANYLGVAPEDIHLRYGPHGKPALSDSSGPLRFNVSNAGELAAFAFTLGCEIGIDIEQHRALTDLERIAHRFFAPEEAAELMELPSAEQTSAFFRCWTRKEAYIKALGGGLSIPLDSFSVTLRPDVPAKFISIDGSADAASDWALQSFDPGPDYAGALAYPDTPRAIHAGPVISIDELMDHLLTPDAAICDDKRV
jgi:4'-phosphopantetheinyl transferase